MVRNHQEWRKIILKTKVHNTLQCLRRRKRIIIRREVCPIHPNTLQGNAYCSFITRQQSQLEVIMNEGHMMPARNASGKDAQISDATSTFIKKG